MILIHKMSYFFVTVICLHFMLCSSESLLDKIENISTLSGCLDYGKIENAEIKLIDEGTTHALHVKCNTGYDMITGRPKVLCVDGQWERIPRPKCARRCIPPFMLNAEMVFDGRKDENGQYYKASATYKCGPGFRLFPENSRQLSCKDGSWTGIKGTCVSDGCERPPEIVFGYYVLKSDHSNGGQSDGLKVSVGQRAHYSCNFGYALDGPEILQCIEAGGWSPRLSPQCIKEQRVNEERNEGDSSCTLLAVGAHTTVTTLQGVPSTATSPAGTVLELRCKEDYIDAHFPCDSSTIYCIDGSWQGRIPSCVEVTWQRAYMKPIAHPPPGNGCLPPAGIQNAIILGGLSVIKRHYHVNEEIVYACYPGYGTLGQVKFTCRSNGCWAPLLLLPNYVGDEMSVIRTFSCDLYVPGNYFGGWPATILLMTSLGAVLLITVMGACYVVCHRQYHRAILASAHHRARRGSGPHSAVPVASGGSGSVTVNSASLLHDPDRVALIAFSDGVTYGESLLPSYEEAIRDQRCSNMIGQGGGGGGGLHGCRTPMRPHWGPPGRRPTTRVHASSNGVDPHVTRQSSSASHNTPSLRSGGDSMGSTDTMTTSDVSTNVTLDTVSSHTCSSGSQSASCRGIFGSLASFDTCSVVNTEGVPLLEENELEDSVSGGSGGGISIDQQAQECGSFKYRRPSTDLA